MAFSPATPRRPLSPPHHPLRRLPLPVFSARTFVSTLNCMHCAGAGWCAGVLVATAGILSSGVGQEGTFMVTEEDFGGGLGRGGIGESGEVEGERSEKGYAVREIVMDG